MITSQDHERVLIIGAGLAGLALAQILRRDGVPFEIFERTDAFSHKKQGWALGLIESLPLLAKLLPQDLGDIQETSVNYHVGDPDSVGIVDGKTGAFVARLGGVAPGEKGHYLRANREHLRNYLGQHLNISTGKALTHYVEDADGVTAFFADGSYARGALLIAADGAFSVVRQQLLGPTHKTELSCNIPMNGTCVLSREDYEPFSKFANSVLFAALPGVFFNIGLCSIQPDRSSAEFYWGVTIRSYDAERDSKWAQQADRKALYEKCLELTRGMPAWMTEIIPKTGPEGMCLPCIRFVEYVTPEAFPKATRVALLGDAAHTMIPFKGAGANTAIADSCDLGTLIIQRFMSSGKSWTGLDKVLDEYNSIMAPRGREAVLASRAAGQDDRGVTEIMHGRIDTGKLERVSQPASTEPPSQRPEKLHPLQRYITTHDVKGNAVFSNKLSSEAPVRQVRGGDMEFSLMYTTDAFPVNMSDDQDMAKYSVYLSAPPPITTLSGTVCRTVDFAPGYASPMHRSVSCDFGVVLEGEVELILDSGETRILKRGDVAVQRGTNHAWRNTSPNGWCRMLYVLQAAVPLSINGWELKEDDGGIN